MSLDRLLIRFSAESAWETPGDPADAVDSSDEEQSAVDAAAALQSLLKASGKAKAKPTKPMPATSSKRLGSTGLLLNSSRILFNLIGTPSVCSKLLYCNQYNVVGEFVIVKTT